MKAHITCCHSRMPFDPMNYVASELQSYAQEWLRGEERREWRTAISSRSSTRGPLKP